MSRPRSGSRGPAPVWMAPAPALLLAALAAGCGEERPAGVVVTDSAGVRITVSPDAGLRYAVLDTVPALSLGGPGVEGPTQFSNVRGVHLDPRGRLWVADGASGEVRVFEADGTFWKAVGGLGEGPGEFLRLRPLGAFRGDSVALWDDAGHHLTVLDPQAGVAYDRGGGWGDEEPLQALAVFRDGSLLAQRRRIVRAASLERGSLLPDTATLVRLDVERPEIEPLGAVPGPLWVWTGGGQVPVPFTINAAFVTSGGDVHVAAGPPFRIEVLGGAGPAERYGVDREPRPVTAAAVAAYRTFLEEAMTHPTQLREHLAPLDHPQRPRLLPGYSRLLRSAGGEIWARVYTPDPMVAGEWDVYAPDRTLLGGVRTPPGFVPMAVRAGRVAGIWRDALGVEHLRVHLIDTLERP